MIQILLNGGCNTKLHLTVRQVMQKQMEVRLIEPHSLYFHYYKVNGNKIQYLIMSLKSTLFVWPSLISRNQGPVEYLLLEEGKSALVG